MKNLDQLELKNKIQNSEDSFFRFKTFLTLTNKISISFLDSKSILMNMIQISIYKIWRKQ